MNKCTCNAKVLDEQWHHYGCPYRCADEATEHDLGPVDIFAKVDKVIEKYNRGELVDRSKPETVSYSTVHGTYEGETLDEAMEASEQQQQEGASALRELERQRNHWHEQYDLLRDALRTSTEGGPCTRCGATDPRDRRIIEAGPSGATYSAFCDDEFHDPVPPSEQPREGARVEVLHPDSTYGRARNRMERESIPTGMEPAQPQPRGEEARVGGRIQEGALSAVRTPTNPPVESRLVPLAPPRGEGDAGKTRGYTREDIQANTWWPGKGGEGDDLAARLEDWAKQVAWPDPVYTDDMARDLRDAAQLLARVSTHPEQSGRVDSDNPDAPDEITRLKDALRQIVNLDGGYPDDYCEIARNALNPASPTPTEQGEGEVECTCTGSDTGGTLLRASLGGGGVVSGLSAEDRARLEGIITSQATRDSITRALALIDQQERELEWQGQVTKALLEAQERYVKQIDQYEKALEAADDLYDEDDGN